MTVKDPRHTPGTWRVAYRRAYDEQVGEFGCVVSLVIDDQIVDLGSVGIVGGNYEDFKRAEANARRIVACVNACAGVPTDALEAGVVRELVEAADRYLRAMTRESDDDPNCWDEEEFAEEWLRNVLARVRGGGDS